MLPHTIGRYLNVTQDDPFFPAAQAEIKTWLDRGWRFTTLVDFVSSRDAFILEGYLVFTPNTSLKPRGTYLTWEYDQFSILIWGGVGVSVRKEQEQLVAYNGDVAVLVHTTMGLAGNRLRPLATEHFWPADRMFTRFKDRTMFLVDWKLVAKCDDKNVIASDGVFLVKFVNDGNGVITYPPLVIKRRQILREAGRLMIFTEVEEEPVAEEPKAPRVDFE